MGLGVIVNDPGAHAGLLNESYDTVFRTVNRQPISALPIPLVMMDIPVFTPCRVHKEISNLDTSKSAGPDQLMTDQNKKKMAVSYNSSQDAILT